MTKEEYMSKMDEFDQAIYQMQRLKDNEKDVDAYCKLINDRDEFIELAISYNKAK